MKRTVYQRVEVSNIIVPFAISSIQSCPKSGTILPAFQLSSSAALQRSSGIASKSNRWVIPNWGDGSNPTTSSRKMKGTLCIQLNLNDKDRAI
ncbi:hypothetical protein L596_025319 [Steinernema carpocapsae]|uniref:Uncharacterized protein n=1 Tax=Steinernema carpocapsae TaxID=34508 RepID=A0A4U5M7F3_STECR|nr:hypothetical protein L596_025319 [Steinernema carpocapsae]